MKFCAGAVVDEMLTRKCLSSVLEDKIHLCLKRLSGLFYPPLPLPTTLKEFTIPRLHCAFSGPWFLPLLLLFAPIKLALAPRNNLGGNL